MIKLDFSNVQHIDKYYREKFTYDVSNYFEVNGWRQRLQNYYGKKKTQVFPLSNAPMDLDITKPRE